MAKKKPIEAPPLVPTEPEAWLDMHQAAAFLDLSYQGLYLRLYHGQKIPHERLGRQYRFQKSALDAWVKSNPSPFRKDRVASRRPSVVTEERQP